MGGVTRSLVSHYLTEEYKKMVDRGAPGAAKIFLLPADPVDVRICIDGDVVQSCRVNCDANVQVIRDMIHAQLGESVLMPLLIACLPNLYIGRGHWS